MKSVFEEMGGTYRQVGDYFIPNLVLPDDGNYQIGKYGRMCRRYLKEHRKILYNNYVLEGTLFKHLAEIDQACNERIETIVSAMAKQEGVTDSISSASFSLFMRLPAAVIEIFTISIISLRPNMPSKLMWANSFFAFSFVFLFTFKLSIAASIKRLSEAINTFSPSTAIFSGSINTFSIGTL